MAHLIPRLGLGLGSNLQAGDQPGPYRILSAAPRSLDFVEYSAPLSLTEARVEASLFQTMWTRRAAVPVLFHPVHLNLWGPDLEAPERLAALADHAEAVDSAWVGNDVAWWHIGGELFSGALYVPPPLTELGLADCVRHARHVQRALPMPLALENPTFTACRGPLHVVDFMARLNAESGCPLVLDLGHLLSHQLARGLASDDGLERLPFEAVVEIHVAGGLVTRHGELSFYLDDHTQPIRDEVFELLAALLPRCPNLCALTYEGDGHPDLLALATLRKLRGMLPDLRARPPVRLEAPRSAEVTPLEGSAEAWRLLDEVLSGDVGITEDARDAIGARVDRDYRLTVMAYQLDRHHPLSRSLLAGSRHELVALARSPELQQQGGLSERYERWAERQLTRAAPECGLLLELERDAQRAFAGPPPKPAPGRFALAADTRLIAVERDLSELLYALRAIRQHLAGRAAATGEYAHSALEVLASIAARAPCRQTWVAVRWRGRLEVIALSPALAELLRRADGEGLDPTRLQPSEAAALREAAMSGLVSAQS